MSVYKFTAMGAILGQACWNVWHVEHPTMSPTILDNFVNEYKSLWETHLKPDQSNNYVLGEYALQRVDEPGWPSLVYPWISNIVGDLTEHPTQTQGCVQVVMRSTTLAPNRARKYFGGFTERDMTNGIWVPALTTDVFNFVSDVIGMYAGDPVAYPEVVTVRYGVGTGVVEAFNPISAWRVDNIPSALSRRKIGRGL